MTVLLAIDQGTTGTRAAVYHPATFAVLGSAYREIPQHFPHDGWVEHAPEDIWRTVGETVTEALAKAGRVGADIAAIGITNQRETVVVWERATGRPVGRAIVWQDRRTAALCQTLASEQDWITAKTGLVLDPYFSGTKLKWLLDADPQVKAAAEQGELAAGTIDSFLIWRLTGGRTHATDTTNASRTLLFDIHKLTWDDDLPKLFGVPQQLLPDVRPSAGDFSVTKGLDFLPDGVPIRAAVGDQQAALFGQGGFAAGGAKCTFGTGAFFLLHTGDTPVASNNKLLTTVAAMPTAEPQYALEGAVFVAGAAVQWLRDGLRLFPTAADTDRLARASDPAEPVLFVPGFVGLGAPHWTPEARGAMFGLTRSTTTADLARAALEGVALQVADLIAAASADLGTPISELRADGGMARNDRFVQTQADLLGLPVVRAAQAESTALGAAFLAGLGCGLVPDTATLAQVLAAGETFTPALPAADRERKVARWRRAVQAVIAFARA